VGVKHAGVDGGARRAAAQSLFTKESLQIFLESCIYMAGSMFARGRQWIDESE
jgi:hypothetical protein